ncbi:putative RNase toxin 24 of polymorphic toxin system [Jatrophihabitans sp. GAS493]|uniref:polymorphic toxin type 24 domain-containing protein n=1 Tax=Jatrophihabitans sp. GAS493 TaxID=1907575 RepID=UPI000BC033C9|nr:polymorphic toxin type 24 domain-containing protein [Jatrophihabitans sp. GAS493]SOD72773.1 putative RNase toxin 24 of polymorphic toxin system [Jatrophihabitans sp. GAS493]
MTAPSLAVDPLAFEGAARSLRSLERTTSDGALRLSSALAATGGISGSDHGGTAWAVAYDGGVREALDGIENYVSGLAHFSTLMAATGANHSQSELNSVIPDQCAPPSSDYPFSPSYVGSGSEVLELPTPDSAHGGSGATPAGWHFISGLVGYLWPNGHQGKLRSTAEAWTSMAAALREPSVSALADNHLAGQQSPEVPLIADYLSEFGGHSEVLAQACESLGGACRSYADNLDDVHSQVIAELRDLVEQSAAFAVIGVGLTIFTAGISDAAATGAVAARAALVATRVGGILGRLIETAGRIAQGVVDALDTVITTTRALKQFLELKVSLAAMKSANAIPVISKVTKAAADVALTEARGSSSQLRAVRSLAERLDAAARWPKQRLPFSDGPPNGLLVKRSPSGEVANYAEYDANGYITKRVDLSGRSHNGVPTPHTVDFVHDKNPTGGTYPRGLSVRPATQSEIP